MIQSAGAHFYQHFVGFYLGLRRITELQHLRPAMLSEDDSFHKWLV
jgi:hypothetical protein